MNLANYYRPTSLDYVVGQKSLIGENGILRNMIFQNNLQNMIFYGPTGTGKTTIAKIMAKSVSQECIFLNATSIASKELKDVVSKANDSEIVLVIDEIHMLNKKQQQLIIDVIEQGNVTLIAMTAENPYFTINKAVRSRCIVLQFEPIVPEDIVIRLESILNDKGIKGMIDTRYLSQIANDSFGDMRTVLNKLNVLINYVESTKQPVNDDIMSQVLTVKSFEHDKDGDSHYNTLSAFHKSMRGSEPNGAIHYLARLIKAEDMTGITRRILCVATEDVGLGNPQAAVIANACVQSALQLGFPEARFPLAHAVVYLCLCPKSDSVNKAIGQALKDIDTISVGDIPNHLKDAHYAGAKALGNGCNYLYPHDYKSAYVNQQYLPDDLMNKSYYNKQDNHMELELNRYLEELKQFNTINP